ncbi:Ras-related protein RABE1a [Diplonema papillatum]|nr:Ras-related protein RABE1a [Diplonema papillatum]
MARKLSLLGNNVSPEVIEKMKKLPRPHCLRVKIVSMGSEGVGKSCLIKRYCEGKFVTKYITTIGIDFGVKPVVVDQTDVKVNFWDLSGNADYFEIRNEFYADAEGVLMVFDVTRLQTFKDLETWWAEAQQYGLPQGIPVTLCGNKTDLPAAAREVPERTAAGWARLHGFTYFETSANTGLNVAEMFEVLFLETYRFSRPF